MVSEGVDIPRLRVGVFATNVVTEMYFRQFCGRFVRTTGAAAGEREAYVFGADDARIRALASRITSTSAMPSATAKRRPRPTTLPAPRA